MGPVRRSSRFATTRRRAISTRVSAPLASSSRWSSPFTAGVLEVRTWAMVSSFFWQRMLLPCVRLRWHYCTLSPWMKSEIQTRKNAQKVRKYWSSNTETSIIRDRDTQPVKSIKNSRKCKKILTMQPKNKVKYQSEYIKMIGPCICKKLKQVRRVCNPN